MACVGHNLQMFCTTSDSSFGPICRDEGEAAELIVHIWRTRGLDPRAPEVTFDEQTKALAELRDGSALEMPSHPRVLCCCGSGLRRTQTMWQFRKEHHECPVHAGEYRTAEVPSDDIPADGKAWVVL